MVIWSGVFRSWLVQMEMEMGMSTDEGKTRLGPEGLYRGQGRARRRCKSRRGSRWDISSYWNRKVSSEPDTENISSRSSMAMGRSEHVNEKLRLPSFRYTRQNNSKSCTSSSRDAQQNGTSESALINS